MTEELKDIKIEEQIDKQKTQKAPEEDKIPSEAWKFCGENVKRRLIEIFKGVWKGEVFPSDWRKGIIIPIYKKGDTDKVINYRGITLLSTAYKIYAAVLNERLKNEMEEKNIPPEI